MGILQLGELPELGRPPIVEVLCGAHFEQMEWLDAFQIASFAETISNDFPKKSMRSALEEGDEGVRLLTGDTLPRPRAWLVSADDTLVAQIQSDRLFINGRSQGGDYPRFDKDGGVKSRFESAYSKLEDYCAKTGKKKPVPRSVIVGKIDHFVFERDWTTGEDLTTFLPGLKPFFPSTAPAMPNVFFRWQYQLEGVDAQVGLMTFRSNSAENGSVPQRGLRLEINAIAKQADPEALPATFDLASRVANAVFASLIPQDQRSKRFG